LPHRDKLASARRQGHDRRMEWILTFVRMTDNAAVFAIRKACDIGPASRASPLGSTHPGGG
jgi:hypothetical protein